LPPPDPAAPGAAAEAEHRWPCESCGADLRFAPGASELRCDHCGHVQAIPAAAAPRHRGLNEIDLARGLADDLAPSEMAEVRATACPSCGAVVEFAGAAHAAECPFCATPVVTGTGSARRIKPQAVLPFVLTEAQARAAMTAWLGRLWFAPGGLVDYARKGRALTGIYVPYWTFDADTRSRYRGQRGDAYYTTKTVTAMENGKPVRRQVQERHIRWRNVSGWVSRRFDDVLVLAAAGLPKGYTDALAPWDLSALKPYAPEFLAGFAAEGYTVGLRDGHREARAVMAAVIRGDVRADIGGDEQRIDRIDTDWGAETFKHVLLPVWMAAYRYSGRSYRFIVNGQTGKVRGERPWSVWKIALAAVLALALAAAAAYLAQDLPR
jgi:LSD1 subclass zinc finger protein